MITSNYQVDGDIYSYADKFFCDSHDDKPSNADAPGGLINGAILEETDTGKTYIFDKKANEWTEKAAGGGGGTGGSTTLSGLTDVDISNPSDGQTLVYNASAGKWENGASSEVLVVTVIATHTTGGETTVSFDKTFAELKSAYEAGSVILCNVGTEDREFDVYGNSLAFLNYRPADPPDPENFYFEATFLSFGNDVYGCYVYGAISATDSTAAIQTAVLTAASN